MDATQPTRSHASREMQDRSVSAHGQHMCLHQHGILPSPGLSVWPVQAVHSGAGPGGGMQRARTSVRSRPTVRM